MLIGSLEWLIIELMDCSQLFSMKMSILDVPLSLLWCNFGIAGISGVTYSLSSIHLELLVICSRMLSVSSSIDISCPYRCVTILLVHHCIDPIEYCFILTICSCLGEHICIDYYEGVDTYGHQSDSTN